MISLDWFPVAKGKAGGGNSRSRVRWSTSEPERRILHGDSLDQGGINGVLDAIRSFFTTVLSSLGQCQYFSLCLLHVETEDHIVAALHMLGSLLPRHLLQGQPSILLLLVLWEHWVWGKQAGTDCSAPDPAGHLSNYGFTPVHSPVSVAQEGGVHGCTTGAGESQCLLVPLLGQHPPANCG